MPPVVHVAKSRFRRRFKTSVQLTPDAPGLQKRLPCDLGVPHAPCLLSLRFRPHRVRHGLCPQGNTKRLNGRTILFFTSASLSPNGYPVRMSDVHRPPCTAFCPLFTHTKEPECGCESGRVALSHLGEARRRLRSGASVVGAGLREPLHVVSVDARICNFRTHKERTAWSHVPRGLWLLDREGTGRREMRLCRWHQDAHVEQRRQAGLPNPCQEESLGENLVSCEKQPESTGKAQPHDREGVLGVTSYGVCAEWNSHRKGRHSAARVFVPGRGNQHPKCESYSSLIERPGDLSRDPSGHLSLPPRTGASLHVPVSDPRGTVTCCLRQLRILALKTRPPPGAQYGLLTWLHFGQSLR